MRKRKRKIAKFSAQQKKILKSFGFMHFYVALAAAAACGLSIAATPPSPPPLAPPPLLPFVTPNSTPGKALAGFSICFCDCANAGALFSCHANVDFCSLPRAPQGVPHTLSPAHCVQGASLGWCQTFSILLAIYQYESDKFYKLFFGIYFCIYFLNFS